MKFRNTNESSENPQDTGSKEMFYIDEDGNKSDVKAHPDVLVDDRTHSDAINKAYRTKKD
ncbi:glutamate--tRNA ligase [Bacillus phage vB_BceM-HSE3]|nr:glutamate--tRNA ligase [Bacillus phage vB_BceM-HSE3]